MTFDAPIHTGEANLPRVLGAGLPAALVFWGSNCAPCKQLDPTLDRLATAFAGRALIVKVNADEEPALARRYGVTHLPSIVFVKDGRTQTTAIGAAPERDLSAWLEYMASGRGSRPAAPTGASVPLKGAAPGKPSGGPAQAATQPPKAEPVVLTDATFDEALRKSNVPVLVDFWAPWCGPCKMIAPTVTELAREFAGRAMVAKVNVDDNPGVAGRYGIMSIPTLLIFKNGQVVDQIVGAQPPQALRQRLARQVN